MTLREYITDMVLEQDPGDLEAIHIIAHAAAKTVPMEEIKKLTEQIIREHLK